MLYTLFVNYAILKAMKEYLINGFKLTKTAEINCVISYYNFGKWILNWNFNYIEDNKLKTLRDNNNYNKEERVLFMCNHVNFLDVFFIPYIFATKFPDYNVMYISKDKYRIIPFIGNYLYKQHILVKNNFEEDIKLIEDKVNEFNNKNINKTVIIIFPEGTLTTPEAMQKSREWCKKIDIESYNNVLAPRTTGIYTLLKSYKPTTIIQGIIKYENNELLDKGTYYSDFLKDRFPCKADIEFKKVDNKFNLNDKKEFDNEYYKYWKNNIDY